MTDIPNGRGGTGRSDPRRAFIHVTRSAAGAVVAGDPGAFFGMRGEAGGIHAGWQWDGRTLVAHACRFGLYPMFYAASRDGVVVSPSIPALLGRGVARALDADALAVFIRLGFFLGEDTAFRDIRALPPGGRLSWGPEGWTVTGGPLPTPRTGLRRAQVVEGYVELFRQSIARRVATGRTAVPLSGGRDSRHILLELHAQRRLPDECVTMSYFPDRHSEDAPVAARLAAAVGVRHRLLPQGFDRLGAEKAKNLLTGFCADEHAWMLPMSEHLRGFDAIYDGIAGDVLSAGLFLDAEGCALYEGGRLRELAERLLVPGREGRLRRMLRPEAHRDLSFERALERLVRELGRYVDFASPLSAFYFWNRTRREIALAPFAVLPGHLDVFCPYLDHDLYDLLSALPASLTLDHRLHDEAIERAYPEFRHVPFETKGPPPHQDWRFPGISAYALRILAELLRPGRGELVAVSGQIRPLLAAAAAGTPRSLDHLRPDMMVYLAQLGEVRSAGPAGS